MNMLIAAAALAAFTHHATGTFDVKMTPIPGETRFPRMTGEKQFHGDLEGTSESEMMSVSGTVEGSAAYASIERVTGSVMGKKGSFILVHSATMRRGGEYDMTIRVVPDSGTGELTGLKGTMQIIIEGATHRYNFDYSIAGAN